ncbi:MAG TPA: transcription elongation factor GreA [Dehalococcoidia bacterium]|jgi:transcription elongation factor GreA|nr:transcription elongation factor GreA [Dehalococcoidia bacterium]
MAEKAVPMTKEGIQRLEKELDHLRSVRRHEVAERIHEAKELASAQNNAEYEEAKNEQAFVEGRILTLEHLLQNATVIDEEAAHHASRVQIGSKVAVTSADGKTTDYTIVGAAEAQPTQGMISNESPVGRALLGKGVGDEVQIQVPKGVLRLTVTGIS